MQNQELKTKLALEFNTLNSELATNANVIKAYNAFDSVVTESFFDSEGLLNYKLVANPLQVYKISYLQAITPHLIKSEGFFSNSSILEGGVNSSFESWTKAKAKASSPAAPSASIDTVESLTIEIVKDFFTQKIEDLIFRQESLLSDLDVLAESIKDKRELSIFGEIVDIRSVLNLLDAEKHAEELSKIKNCFRSQKTDVESILTGNSKGLTIKLLDAAIAEGSKIEVIYKDVDNDKPLVNQRLIDIGFTGIKWAGKTSLSVNLT